MAVRCVPAVTVHAVGLFLVAQRAVGRIDLRFAPMDPIPYFRHVVGQSDPVSELGPGFIVQRGMAGSALGSRRGRLLVTIHTKLHDRAFEQPSFIGIFMADRARNVAFHMRLVKKDFLCIENVNGIVHQLIGALVAKGARRRVVHIFYDLVTQTA